MNKIKKVVSSFAIFIAGIISKVYAIQPVRVISMYGVDPGPKKNIGKTISRTTIPIVLFIIGLLVVFSKKITNKIKVIVISGLIALGIFMWYIINYVALNF